MDSWKECAQRLIETQELDPVYTMLCGASKELDNGWLNKFCLYHLMFYDVGGAIHAAKLHDREFWPFVQTYYHTLRRGQERRHFRGQNGLNSIASLMAGPPPQLLVASLRLDASSYEQVYNSIRAKYSGFGEYTCLKWADYLDHVFQTPVDFRNLHKYLFSGATAGLESIWPGRSHQDSLAEITDYISQFADPFSGRRKCGPSEAETVACGYKVYYVNTTFKFGYDTRLLHQTLTDVGGKYGSLLRKYAPKAIPE